ncbi:MAG: hypothetical protein AAB915_00350 [Patescibacteria group bacterium]
MENTNKVFTKVTALVFLIGIVVGFGSASLWLRRSTNVETSGDAAAVSESMPAEGLDEAAEKSADLSLAEISAALSGGKSSVSVADQPAGDRVSVSAALEGAAWIVIHEDSDGEPGRILGAQMFPAGANSGVVELLRGTSAAHSYYAMIHADDDDREFSTARDMPVKNADGNPVMAKFNATAPAPTGAQ